MKDEMVLAWIEDELQVLSAFDLAEEGELVKVAGALVVLREYLQKRTCPVRQ